MKNRPKSVCGVLGLVSMLLAAVAAAGTQTPVKYTAMAVTDVKLGHRLYHRALVFLTFTGIVDNVQSFGPVYAGPGGDEASGQWLLSGDATVRIVSGIEEITARFLPGQIVISYDWYNGGIGFGAYVGTGASRHLEPAYPLAFDDCCDGEIYHNSPTPDSKLTISGTWSGNAWSCVGFPVLAGNGNGHCSDPTDYPLATTRGDLVVYQPFNALNPDDTIYDDYGGSLNAGIFTTHVGP